MVVGIVLGSIALFLCLLLLCPLKLSLWYGEDLTLKIGYGPDSDSNSTPKGTTGKDKKRKETKKRTTLRRERTNLFPTIKGTAWDFRTAALGNRGYQAGSLHHEKAVLSCGGVSSPG